MTSLILQYHAMLRNGNEIICVVKGEIYFFLFMFTLAAAAMMGKAGKLSI